MKRVKIVVKGQVQGVFFRHSTKREADKLGIVGYVKNLENGGVEIVAEGAREQLEKLIAWASHGPEHAKVTSCETNWDEACREFSTFEIL